MINILPLEQLLFIFEINFVNKWINKYRSKYRNTLEIGKNAVR